MSDSNAWVAACPKCSEPIKFWRIGKNIAHAHMRGCPKPKEEGK